MDFSKQRRLMVESCESREMLSANGLAVADPLEVSKPAEVASVAVTSNEVVAPIPGDFDADGAVDGNDYLVWQVGFGDRTMDGDDFLAWQAGFGDGQASGNGQVTDAIPGDFDANGAVDGNDFLVWQVGFGDGTMDGDDFLAWQIGHGMDNDASGRPAKDRIARTELPAGNRLVLAIDVVMENWAARTMTKYASSR